MDRRLRLFVTGGTGVLGRALRPLAEAAGHEFAMRRHDELELFDRSAVEDAVQGSDAVLHLATRVRPVELLADLDAWRENDRLRADASRILVDAALTTGVAVYVQPTVAFVYPSEGPVSEDTPLGDDARRHRSGRYTRLAIQAGVLADSSGEAPQRSSALVHEKERT